MRADGSRLSMAGGRGRMPFWAWAVLLLITLIALWPGQTTIPVMDRDEARYAQASRQMLETGDFVDIRFQDTPRLVKPAGIYWLQAASAAVAGGADAPIWAYRLPSLLGAVAAVVVTAWLATRMAGPQVGLAAGLLLAVSLVVSVEARTAKTDAALLAAVTIAQAALYLISERNDQSRSRFFGAPLVFWAASGVSLMIKGPIGSLVSATTILALVAWRRDWRWLRHLRVGPGLLVVLAVVAPWVIAITLRTDGGFLHESIGHALLGKVARADDAHGAPPGYHTLLFFVTFWPGAVFAGLAGYYAWLRRRERAVQFLVAWIVPTWVLFEAVVTKLPHYTLPVFPGIAILAALALRDAAMLLQNRVARRLHQAAMIVFVVIGLALGLVAPAASLILDEGLAPPSIVAGLLGLIAVIAGIWAARAADTRSLLALAGSVALFYAVTFYSAIPALHALWPSNHIGAMVNSLHGCDEVAVATAGYREPSNVFVLGTDTVLGDGAQAAQFLLDHRDCGIVAVDQAEKGEFLQQLQQAGVTERSLGAIDGINYSKGDPLKLELFVTQSSPLQRVGAAPPSASGATSVPTAGAPAPG